MDWFSFRPPFSDAVERPGLPALYQRVEDRIDRAVLGKPWLKRRFAAVDELTVTPRYTDAGRASVVEVGVLRGSRKRVAVTAAVPSAWRDGRLDGLLGYRLTLLALDALQAAGEHLELGPCELRPPRKDRGTDELPLFGPPGPDDDDLERRVLAALAPGAWVMAGPVPAGLRRWCADVSGRLGAQLIDQPLPDPAAASALVRVDGGPHAVGYWLGQFGDFAESALSHPVVLTPPPDEPAFAMFRDCVAQLARQQARPDSLAVWTGPSDAGDDSTGMSHGRHLPLYGPVLDVAEGELAAATLLPRDDHDAFDAALAHLERVLDGVADVGESNGKDDLAYWILTPTRTRRGR